METGDFCGGPTLCRGESQTTLTATLWLDVAGSYEEKMVFLVVFKKRKQDLQ